MARSNSQSIPLQTVGSPKLRQLFDKVDTNSDGYISYCELWGLLRTNSHGLPQHIIRCIHERADRNDDGQLDYEEFVHMVHDPQNFAIFKRYMNRYIHLLVPHKRATAIRSRGVVSDAGTDEGDGAYEDEYSCVPPAVGMVIISLIEICLFCIDAANGSTEATGPVATALLYNPHKRIQAWRYLTYMFVHVGYFHLVINLLVQILLGTPLEMVHRWWRVWIIYFAGVVAGSLGTSIMDPSVKLAGASGGVYSLITAHMATIIMNWKEMSYPCLQMLIFVIVTGVDVSSAIYNRYIMNKEEHIGYAAHFFGALAGLLIGITLLRNLEVNRTEKIVQKVAIVLYILLMGTAIIWNIAYTSYFPVQY